MEIYKYNREKYFEILKKERKFTVLEEIREYKNERYLSFKEKGWTKKLNKPKIDKIESTSPIEVKEPEE
jgi:hypothetical protein